MNCSLKELDDHRKELEKQLKAAREESEKAAEATKQHLARREAEEEMRRQLLQEELAGIKAAAEEAEKVAAKAKAKLKKAKAKARKKKSKSSSDDKSSTSSSDEEDGVEERREEANAVEQLRSEGHAEFEERPLEILWSTFVIQKMVTDVGGVDKSTPRTLKELIQWKRKTLDSEFKDLKGMVKKGGRELRKKITDLYHRLIRTEQLGVCVAAGVMTQLLAEADPNLGELVHDTATGMCRTDPADWEEFKEQRSKRPVGSKLLDWDESLEDEAGFKALVVRGKDNLEAGKSWAVLMGAITNTLCKEQKRAETRHNALRGFLVMKNGAVNPKHEMMQQRPENADTLVGKHNRWLKRLRKKLVELNMLKYMPRDEEIVENLMLSARSELRKEIERQMLEDNIHKDSVEDDWDFMTNRMYMAEERLEEETKIWSGSTQPETGQSSSWCPLHETSGHDASECRGLGKGGAKGKGGKKSKSGKW